MVVPNWLGHRLDRVSVSNTLSSAVAFVSHGKKVRLRSGPESSRAAYDSALTHTVAGALETAARERAPITSLTDRGVRDSFGSRGNARRDQPQLEPTGFAASCRVQCRSSVTVVFGSLSTAGSLRSLPGDEDR